MDIVFFVIGYLIFAWIMGRILDAMLEKLLGDGTGPRRASRTFEFKPSVKVATTAKPKPTAANQDPSFVLNLEMEGNRRHRLLGKKINP